MCFPNEDAVGNDHLLGVDLPAVAAIDCLNWRNPCATNQFHRREE